MWPFTVAVPFYISTRNALGFQFICIFHNIDSFVLFLQITILMDLKWYLICLIFSPL